MLSSYFFQRHIATTMLISAQQKSARLEAHTEIIRSQVSIQQNMCLPADRKMLLSIRETTEYSNIGINKINDMLKQSGRPFVLFGGTKKLLKRIAFEAYIDGKISI